MNQKIISILNLVSKSTILVVTLITPLLFWNITSEFYETPKLLLIAAATAILLIVWAARWMLEGRISMTRSPLDLPIFLLLLVFIVSTIFTVSRTTAIFGGLPRIHGGLASFVVYTLFYFSLVSNLKQQAVVKQALHLLLIAGVILSSFSLLSYLGVNVLSLPWTAGLNFTLTGSSFSTNAILILLTPILLISLLLGKGRGLFDDHRDNQSNFGLGLPPAGPSGEKSDFVQIPFKIILVAILILFAVTIVVTGNLASWIGGAVAYGLVLFVVSSEAIKKNLPFIALPLLVAAVVAVLSFLPLAGSKNFLHTQSQNFPREVQLPFNISWKVSVSAFRDSPFWGTGPATYLADFTQYKPVEFNNLKFWNVRFDSAYNEYLQVLATLGSLGLIALLLLAVIFVSLAFKYLSAPKDNLGKSLAISGITFFILLAFHTSTLTLWVVGLLILASFVATHREIAQEVKMGITDAYGTIRQGQLQVSLVLAVMLLVIIGLVITAVYYTTKFTVADYHHRQALNAVARGQGLEAYNQLIKAENRNPFSDLYRLDMAQTNFALANAIATAKGPTEASPAGSLTDQDKLNIQTLLSQSINEAKTAVVLNPNNPGNWEVLGAIYRQISGVAQNALAFALDSYGRAIQRDPLNPNLRLVAGGIYYSVKNYDMAIRFFTDAVNIKPDFANGYFNLAIALNEKGNIAEAVASMEKTVTLLDPNSQDYKVAAELLSKLKDRAASESAKQQAAQQANQISPANQPGSALENQELPKVLDLPKPENIATPPAVKKQTRTTPTPPPTGGPTPTVTPNP